MQTYQYYLNDFKYAVTFSNYVQKIEI